ncbi:hypothetical protein [Agathobaculum desmolans]|uniref:hypothetical protein n=1 Tax=Agathobaculum desmolans TaxID=39484 RepID=UPI00294334E9|nr:hypothetical protein [Agathobaculum desmolans]
MPADLHGASFSRAKDIVKTIENLAAVKLTTKITEKSAVILIVSFHPDRTCPAPPSACSPQLVQDHIASGYTAQFRVNSQPKNPPHQRRAKTIPVLTKAAPKL